MHNNHRTELKKAMLEGFSISSVVKKGIEEDTLLNDKEADVNCWNLSFT